MSCPIVTRGRQWRWCLITTPGLKPDRPVQQTSIVRTWDVRKQLSSAREDDDPSNSEKNLSHPLQSSSPAGQLSSLRAGHTVNTTLSFFWKNKLSLLLFIIQNGMSCSAKRRFSSRRSSLFWHFTKLTSLWLIEVLFKQRAVGKQSSWFYDVELEGNIIWMLSLVNIYLIFIDDYFCGR